MRSDAPRPGWWTGDVALEHGTRYAFSVDGGDPRPDPRSRRQPEGVHGLSRRYEPESYAWGDGAWTGRPLAGGSVYELHVGTFTPEGTLDAAIGRLGHLVEGRQDLVDGCELTFGQSITDACIGWADTEVLLRNLADAVAARNAL